MDKKTLAVVIPIFNEEENLPELFRRLREVFNKLDGIDARVIYVNDGSRDRSLEIMTRQHREDGRFGVVDLSRNFGHQAALAAGLAHVRADAVVLMDGDLQDPPEVIPDLTGCWQAGGQVVRAERRSRAETGLRRLGIDLFHGIFCWISDFPIAPGAGIFGLLDKKALAELQRLPEKNRFLPGLQSWIGFDQRTVTYDRHRPGRGRTEADPAPPDALCPRRCLQLFVQAAAADDVGRAVHLLHRLCPGLPFSSANACWGRKRPRWVSRHSSRSSCFWGACSWQPSACSANTWGESTMK